MHKKTIFRSLIQQIVDFIIGIRLSCGLLTASLRSIHTVFALIILGVISFLYYIDVIIGTLCGGGSALSWGIINLFRRRGLKVNMEIPGMQWLFHLPESLILFSLFGLISLIFMHILKSNLNGESCGVGRAFFRALRSWRFIIFYALCTGTVAWCIGDMYLIVLRWVFARVGESALLVSWIYYPVYGTKVIEKIATTPYWLPEAVRLGIGGLWYFGTFLLFPVLVSKEGTFFECVYRSFRLAFCNIGLVLSAALTYILIYASLLGAAIYLQIVTLPSFERLSMTLAATGRPTPLELLEISIKMSVLSAGPLLLCAVHSAFVISGSLITAFMIYRICTETLVSYRNQFFVERPYRSFFMYILFFSLYWIVVRCGIYLLMPTI